MINKMKNEMQNQVMKYQVEVWSDEFDREEGFSDKTIMEDTIENVIKEVLDAYHFGGVEDDGGAIEINLLDSNGDWLKSLYHISEDSNDELEELVGLW